MEEIENVGAMVDVVDEMIVVDETVIGNVINNMKHK